MASRIAEAYVQIVPRIDGVAKGINSQLSGQMTTLGQSGGTGFAAGFKKVAGPAIAAAIAVAGVALIRFGKDAILAAEQARQASQRVDAIAKSMGIFGDQALEVSGRIQNFAEEQEKLIAVDADVIKGAQAKLLTFKELARSADESGGAFDRATLAAVDLAAAGFGTAETNAVQLGKALNDPIKGITALTRSGITFTEAEKEKIKALVESGDLLTAQDLVLKAIETQVGGTAAATALSSEKIRLGFESVKDSIGELLLPAFDSVATVLSEKVFPAVKGFFDSIKENGLGPTIKDTLTNLSTLRQNLFDAIINALPGIIDAIVAFIPILVQNMVTMYTSILNAIVGALPQIIEAAITLFNGIIDGLLQVLPVIIQAIVTAIPQLINAIVSALPKIIDGAIKLFLGIVEGITRALPEIIAALVGAIPQIIKAITDALPKLIDGAIELFLGIIRGLTEAMPQIIDAIVEAMPEIIAALIEAVPLFIEAGIELLKGLAKGIIDNAPKIVKAAIEGVADIAITTFKSLLGIKSPSLVFQIFGRNITEGLVVGITSGSKDVLSSLDELATKITDYWDKLGSFFGGGDRAASQLKLIEQFKPILGAIESQYKGIIDSVLKAQDELGKKVKEKFDYITGLAKKFGATLSITQTTTLKSAFQDLTKRITEAKELRELTNQLVAQGLNRDLYKQIVESGSVGFARSILAGGQEAVDQLNQLSAEANKQAGMLAEDVGSVLFDEGIAFAENVVAGLQNEKKAIFAVFTETAQRFAYEIYKAMAFSTDVAQVQFQMADAWKKPFKGKRPGPDKAGAETGEESKNGKWIWGGPGYGWYPKIETSFQDKGFEDWVRQNPNLSMPGGIDTSDLMQMGGAKVVNYYAAPNQSIDSEAALFQAMNRAKVITQW